MRPGRFSPFYPQRIFWTGAALLGGVASIASGYLLILSSEEELLDVSSVLWQSPIEKSSQIAQNEVIKLNDFSLELKPMQFEVPLPRIAQEFVFSMHAPRPGTVAAGSSIFIRSKQSAELQKANLPCKLGLQYVEGGRLAFSQEEPFLFWMELSQVPSGQIQALVFVETRKGEIEEADRFPVFLQESPIFGPKDFRDGSPFRVLAECRWFGQDLFFEKYAGGAILQKMGPEHAAKEDLLSLQKDDWLVWENDLWIKGPLPKDPTVPIARVSSSDSRALILEGWDGEAAVRIALPLYPPLKARGAEIFDAIRIRSERQISCTMDKQCLILRCGDWVLKGDNKWKILKRTEEKQAYRLGKITGELFVFENIESRQGQKYLQGSLFSPERTQSHDLEIPVAAHSNRRVKGLRK